MSKRTGPSRRRDTHRGGPSAAAPRASTAHIWIGVALAALACAVFAPVRHFGLVNWDDPQYIADNLHVRGGLSVANALWALTAGSPSYWHPVTWLSHQLDVQIYGADAGGYHVTNLVLHVANTLLLFFGLRRLTTWTGASAVVAAVFAVHPLHVESVAWVTERKDVLSAFFELLTIGAYVRYVAEPRARRYAVVLALFALALMSKPMVVTLPIALLLVDIWPLARPDTWRTRLLEKVPLVLMSIMAGIATILVQGHVGAVASLAALPWPTRVANAIVGCAWYLGHIVWPVHLAAFYPIETHSAGAVLLILAALVAVTAIAYRARRTQPYALVGWLWFLVTLAPVSGLVQAGEQATADRFSYVPMIGVLVIAAWGASDAAARLRVPAGALAALAAALVVVSAVAAHAQVNTWSDSVSLWRHALEVTDRNYAAHEKLGDALRDRGDLEEARAQYEQALAFAPPNSPVYTAVIRNDLGLAAMRLGRIDDAVKEFEMAVQSNPGFGEAQTNLGNALGAAGRPEEALAHVTAAVALSPDSADARMGQGHVLLKLGRTDDALRAYTEAIKLDPSMAEAHNGLGGALATLGRGPEAEAQYAEALVLNPRLVSAHVNLAVLLARRGDRSGAREHVMAALAIDPASAPARELLKALGGLEE